MIPSKPLELSGDERAKIADMLQSDGWKIITDKVLPWQTERSFAMLRGMTSDHRYYQGFLDGMDQLMLVIANFYKTPEQILPRVEPDETAYFDRKKIY